MAVLSDYEIKKAIEEIGGEDEKNRRARQQKRLDIYKDGGSRFLMEALNREFGQNAIKEMRPIPINIFKKIINKRYSLYNKAPIRIAKTEQEQKLVDYYTAKVCVNEVFKKGCRYYGINSNTNVYVIPQEKGEGKFCIYSMTVPSTLYSKMPDPSIRTKTRAFIFNSFLEDGMIATQSYPSSATGASSFSPERGLRSVGDSIDSEERATTDNGRKYIWWTDEEHFTTDESGSKLLLAGASPDQTKNPIEIMPIVEICKDRDNEAWAEQGDDLVDCTSQIQLAWTDLMTIAKHQGFSQLVIKSTEEPKQMTIGINKAIWLKQEEGQPDPSIDFVQASSPLDSYKEVIGELIGLTLTTNDMNPGSITGKTTPDGAPSGFSKLIEMADILQAIQDDVPVFKKAEEQFWTILSRWHNYLLAESILDEEAAALGKFPDNFTVEVQYKEIRPLESEEERIKNATMLLDKGLITRKQAIKRLNPDSTDAQVDQLLAEIEKEKEANMASINEAMRLGNVDQPPGANAPPLQAPQLTQ